MRFQAESPTRVHVVRLLSVADACMRSALGAHMGPKWACRFCCMCSASRRLTMVEYCPGRDRSGA